MSANQCLPLVAWRVPNPSVVTKLQYSTTLHGYENLQS